MPQTRRRFLRIAGTSGLVLAATAIGGGAAFVATRRPDKALAPWETVGQAYDDPRLRALSYAILAPNPHNMQPWMVQLDGDDGFTLLYDLDRMLPETDPFNRQIVIGLGCFLEIMRMAAAAEGLRADIQLFPDGEPEPLLDGRPVARVRLMRDGDMAPDPLFAHLFDRRSTKEPFDTSRPVAREIFAQLEAVAGDGVAVGTLQHADEIAAMRELTWQAHMIEVETPRTYLESVEVMRFGKAEIEASPDGIDMGGPLLEALNHAGILTRKSLSNMTSSSYQQGVELYRRIIHSAMGYVFLSTQNNSRTEQIAAGRDWVRINLSAVQQGICVHPLSQALQEYKEMHAKLDDVHEMLGQRGRRVQMLARVGYGPAVSPSPRWDLKHKLIL